MVYAFIIRKFSKDLKNETQTDSNYSDPGAYNSSLVDELVRRGTLVVAKRFFSESIILSLRQYNRR